MGGIFAGHNGLMAILTIPDRNAMPPPKLPADAPILNVFHPVEKDLGEPLRHEYHFTFLHRFSRLGCQRIHLDEPLG